MPGNCISSGCLYNLRNIDFINTIIDFRKQKWQEVIDMVNKKKVRILPEDYQLWLYLGPYFKDNIYTSLLIPTILVHHGIERSVFNYL
jgi:hypothetical protein